jgi:hypothetical protein
LSDSSVSLVQFEPERFIEGLLGIGVAGGGTKKSNEGAILAARLVEMRKERDARAKVKMPVVAPAANPTSPEPVMANTPSPNVAAQKPNRPKNKKKKSKGKK